MVAMAGEVPRAGVKGTRTSAPGLNKVPHHFSTGPKLISVPLRYHGFIMAEYFTSTVYLRLSGETIYYVHTKVQINSKSLHAAVFPRGTRSPTHSCSVKTAFGFPVHFRVYVWLLIISCNLYWNTQMCPSSLSVNVTVHWRDASFLTHACRRAQSR